MNFRELYMTDIKRYGDSIDRYRRRLHFWLRKTQSCRNKWLRLYYKWRFVMLRAKNGIEINPMMQIGKGLYLGHPYNITINRDVVIGDNCNIHKGVTIGQENRGRRKGSPVIGNKVWIGIGAVVVGKIKIGDNVLIAPNAYVNCDVPNDSVVFGNPCIIKHRDDATEAYINREV